MAPENRAEGEFVTWRAPGCPFTVACLEQVLDDIRVAIVDAFFLLPRGGVEIGGVLLGNYEEARLSILDYAPFECEHAFGPSFTLSPSDHKNLEELLLKPPRGVDALEPVGWYHSHTRTDIFLSEADLDIYRRYFPKQWQVALVLRPSTVRATRAGFFFREADGTVHSAASRREFALGPTANAPLPPQAPESAGHAQAASAASTGMASSLPEPLPMPLSGAISEPLPATISAVEPGLKVSAPIEALEPVSRSSSSEMPASPTVSNLATSAAATKVGAPAPDAVAIPSPPAAEPLPIEASSSQRVGGVLSQGRGEALLVETSPSEPIALDLKTPNFQTFEPKRSLRWLVSIAAVLAGVGLGIAAVKLARLWMPPVNNLFNPPAASVSSPSNLPPLGLNAVDSDGQLQVRWDPTSLAVRQARQAVLTISDGGSSTSIPLDPQHLASGVFAYARQGERVDVSLTLQQADGRQIEEATGFLGKLPERRSGPQSLERGRDELAQPGYRPQADRPSESAPKNRAEQSTRERQAETVGKGRGRKPSFDPLGP